MITTASSNEIYAADMMFIDQNTALLTYIDYYTRLGRCVHLFDKSREEIINGLKNIFNGIGQPKALITDNGKEFINEDFKKFTYGKNITRHTTS